MSALRIRSRSIVIAFVLAAIASVAAVVAAQSTASTSELVVHEWGTFTSVAGADGAAIQWRPLSTPSDLPCFVRGLAANVKGPIGPDQVSPSPVLGGLAATVRMETPVLYFYTPAKQRVDVSVQFPSGLITEWFPNAAVQPAYAPASVTGNTSVITWSGVDIMPGADVSFFTEPGKSHYYAARATEASPLKANGQTEKFLFYRGLGAFQVPVLASETKTGQKIVVESPNVTLGHVVLFENRNGHIGYRIVDNVKGRLAIERPELTSNVDTLGWDLERMLTSQGLFPREAKAMVDTWRDSWFEEGARVFYLLPQSTVDALLPLNITPKPANTARAFVGRVEVFTSEVLADVEQASLKNDLPTLNKYGRFLEPIAWRLLGQSSPVLDSARVTSQLRLIAASHVPEATCR